MNHKLIYNAGAVISFLGWFLAFSPHVLHHAVGFLPDDHASNIYVGMAIGLAGLGMLFTVRKKC
ncbi:hypothetical protein HY492_01460 [Candidatus Woesearchaeota archaeon]|nr:hypothetical protein [Candidatus Woesearchaeota archaeon]